LFPKLFVFSTVFAAASLAVCVASIVVLSGQDWLSFDSIITTDLRTHFKKASTYNLTSSSRVTLESNLWDTNVVEHDQYSLYINGTASTATSEESHHKSEKVKQNDEVYGADDDSFDYNVIVINQAGAVTSMCFSFIATIVFVALCSAGQRCFGASRLIEFALGLIYMGLGVLQIAGSAMFEAQAATKVEGLERDLKHQARNFTKVETLGGNANVTDALNEAFAVESSAVVCGSTCEMQLYVGIASLLLGVVIAALAAKALQEGRSASSARLSSSGNAHWSRAQQELTTANPAVSEML
jgi:hypothetical protein